MFYIKIFPNFLGLAKVLYYMHINAIIIVKFEYAKG